MFDDEDKIFEWKATSKINDKSCKVYADNEEDALSLATQIYGEAVVKKTGKKVLKMRC